LSFGHRPKLPFPSAKVDPPDVEQIEAASDALHSDAAAEQIERLWRRVQAPPAAVVALKNYVLPLPQKQASLFMMRAPRHER
jgi:hypothetical protein